MPRRSYSFVGILETLRRHRVRFVLVGGVAAVVEGAPVSTFDVDIVPARRADNVERLLTALRELDAYYRTRPELRRRPTPDALSGDGNHLLMTRYGPLDVLGVVGRGRDFDALLNRSTRRKLGNAYIHVLDIEAQIAVKEEVEHEKDRMVLPVLREALRLQVERRKRGPRKRGGRTKK